MASAAVAAAAAPLRRSLLPSLNPSCLFSSLASSSHRLSLPRALRPAGPLPSDTRTIRMPETAPARPSGRAATT
uniref:Uncharacterized protein n=1 Tax=Oryza rufipogon TaxID=4529 RepID=A0A0E0P6D3_ORYRU